MSETTNAAPAAFPVKVKLSRPVQVLDTQVSEFSLRAPIGQDLVECGYPLHFSADGGFEFQAPEMSKLIARLASVPLTSVLSLTAGDWTYCAGITGGFLGAMEAQNS